MADQSQQPDAQPQDGPRDEGNGEEPQPFQHVADSCDMQWHNPACGGNPLTWKRTCTLQAGTCTCLHA